MNEEYTYDIDKYTIGVDANGEDGIGMTVAIIENGEINVLGSYYGENARCLDSLIKEIQKLKKKYGNAVADYENTMFEKEQLNSLVNSCQEEIRQLKKQVETYEIEGYEQNEELNKKSFDIRKYKTQQKEFIKYMNDIIEDLETEDVDDEEMKGYLIQRINTFKEILSKFKEITGVSDDKK